ncbi:ribonuclease P/MRP protein subunit POP5-like [Patiria miniata]|uniref:Ribonuclease P/MRP protein subunit POP5 n=1 Tax=Patiria miniata TaxID=46514 RepID=A0A914A6A2_PATMI|nr:ribonuclease P/MRP protein subunit POP5-like [Patiria miniata]XP_038059391.1 ribonuclease P/MRP protein subunit POP5-like [Patiria miniata]XP_038059392.1 ribonuclease P/MRP protein subunit POP5-like [Patiria miniata]
MVRIKNRYFLCELVFEDAIWRALAVNNQHLYNAVKDAVRQIHGDYGAAAIAWGLNVKYLNPDTGVMMIRVRRQNQKILSTTLPFIKSVASFPVTMRTLHISGTIRSCQKFLVKYNRRQLVVLLRQCRTKEERQKVRESIRRCTLEQEEEEFGDGALEDT